MRSALVALVVAGLVAGCGSDDLPSETTLTTVVSEEAVAAAVGVCGVLVDFAHQVADEVNAASRQITLGTDPDIARTLLLEATDAISDGAAALPGQYAALGLTEEGDIGRLVSDASAASEAVAEQLDAITAELTDGLEGEGAREILSATFIDMEKVQSLSQPDQGDYDDPDLVAALDTEESCEHSISR